MTEATSKQKKELAKQLKIKLKLERKLSVKMRRFLRKINRVVFPVFDDTGEVVDANFFQDELDSILTDHWTNTVSAFAPITIDAVNDVLRDDGLQPIAKDNPMIVFALLAFIRNNVIESSRVITNTTNKEIAQSIVTEDGDAKLAKKRMDARALSRSEMIGATEIQKASEGAKQIALDESQSIAVAESVGVITFVSTKTWLNTGKNVRVDHSIAQFQTVPILQPFLVGGELLMYPGDTSLGASIWNIINCKCMVSYSVIKG